MKREETKQETHHHDNSCGITSVVLGITALIFASIFGLLLGIVSLSFGIKQNKLAKNKWSRWGIILSLVAIVLSIAVIIFNVWFAASNTY